MNAGSVTVYGVASQFYNREMWQELAIPNAKLDHVTTFVAAESTGRTGFDSASARPLLSSALSATWLWNREALALQEPDVPVDILLRRFSLNGIPWGLSVHQPSSNLLDAFAKVLEYTRAVKRHEVKARHGARAPAPQPCPLCPLADKSTRGVGPALDLVIEQSGYVGIWGGIGSEYGLSCSIIDGSEDGRDEFARLLRSHGAEVRIVPDWKGVPQW